MKKFFGFLRMAPFVIIAVIFLYGAFKSAPEAFKIFVAVAGAIISFVFGLHLISERDEDYHDR